MTFIAYYSKKLNSFQRCLGKLILSFRKTQQASDDQCCDEFILQSIQINNAINRWFTVMTG